jgi:5-methylcytosine-specific restriction endonuclease McrA
MKKRTQGMHWIRDEKRLAIYLRDGMACIYCQASVEQETKLTLDHIKPYSKGGTNDAGNLVTCCLKCNSSRGTRPVSAFVEAVAEYTEQDPKEIRARIRRHRGRAINVAEAKELMTARN